MGQRSGQRSLCARQLLPMSKDSVVYEYPASPAGSASHRTKPAPSAQAAAVRETSSFRGSRSRSEKPRNIDGAVEEWICGPADRSESGRPKEKDFCQGGRAAHLQFVDRQVLHTICTHVYTYHIVPCALIC